MPKELRSREGILFEIAAIMERDYRASPLAETLGLDLSGETREWRLLWLLYNANPSRKISIIGIVDLLIVSGLVVAEMPDWFMSETVLRLSKELSLDLLRADKMLHEGSVFFLGMRRG